ncbi:O-antigen ligase family protein [Microcoleus sp. FACHB-68]|uniref:O-antigen ligase family protein n=1 Tax=Microcoleus sp. FACHB-68 TaxID=2692826 RepID=UPI0016867AB9|nr:O-antigen ligase family protein [Microcoleus sp. FACHB-68]MBD1936400.1 O-antigen ligase family protein [Microcoleus sp. FACHB-68]
MKAIQIIIFSSPLLSSILAVSLIILIALFFHSSSYKKISYYYQKGFAIFFLFLSPALEGRPPLNYLHPTKLAETNKTNMHYLWIPFMAFCFIILFSRIQHFLKYSISIFSLLLSKNPCFWIYATLPFFSIFWSETPDIAFAHFLAYILITPVAVYLAVQYDWQDLARFVRWSHIMIGVGSYIHQRPGSVVDWSGLTKSKNKLGGIMCLSTAFWYVNYSQAVQSKAGRWLSLLMTLVSFYLMRTGKSGGALVAVILLIGMVLSLGFIKQLSFQWAFACIASFIIVSIAATIIITDNLEAIIVEGLGKDMTLTGRTEFWPQIFARVVEKRLLTGFGYYSFWQPELGINNPAKGIFTTTGFIPPHSHNGYLEILVYFGLLGLALFTISFVINLVMAVQYLIKERLELSAIPMIFLMYLTLNNITETTIIEPTNVWVYYVMLTVRLSLDTSFNNTTATSKPKRTERLKQSFS